jgi:hypothetical protein
MPIDFNKPALTDNYATVFVPRLLENQRAVAQWLDPAVAGALSNVPVGAYRLNAGAVERYNGAIWVAQAINGINFVGGNIGFGGITAPATRLEADVSGASGVQQRFRVSESPPSVPVGGLGGGVLINWGSVHVGMRVVHGGDLNNAGLSFQVGNSGFGVEAARLSRVGQFALGTTGGTGARLHVYEISGDNEIARFDGTSQPFVSFYRSGTRRMYIQSSPGNMAMVVEEAASLRFGTSGIERVRITDVGNVGIGAEPLGKFHVETAGAAQNSYFCAGLGDSFVNFRSAGVTVGYLGFESAKDAMVVGAFGGKDLLLLTGTISRLAIRNSNGTVEPAVNNAQSLGSSGVHWQRVYTYNIERTDTGPLTIASAGGGGQIDLSVAGVVRQRIGSAGRTLFAGGVYTGSSVQPFTTTPIFDAHASNYFEFSGGMIGNVTSCTINNPAGGQTISIRVQQDGTGGRTFAAPANSRIAGTLANAANTTSILTLTYSATLLRWEGSWLQLPA